MVEGANGAGKTSLLRACAGLLPVTGGEISVLGHDLRARPAAVRRHVGLLAHAPALYDDLSVAENVRFAVRAAGGDVGRVDAALERMGLGGRLRRSPGGKLSAGQRRRVALAVLVARDPVLWLLDEPHAALDAEGRVLFDEVLSAAVAAGATVMVASHDPVPAIAGMGRVVTMSGGRVVSDVNTSRPRVVGSGSVGSGPAGSPAGASGGAHVA
jgi:heme ABC exporter ATP-binding subunit CcmA